MQDGIKYTQIKLMRDRNMRGANYSYIGAGFYFIESIKFVSLIALMVVAAFVAVAAGA